MSSRWWSCSKSLRVRLLLASRAVEVLLVGNCLHLIQGHLIGQAEARIASMELAHNLRTVAEFVATPTRIETASKLGVDYA